MSGEGAVIHEPRCNTYCAPNAHYLTDGIGLPHIHRTDMAGACGECAPPAPSAADRMRQVADAAAADTLARVQDERAGS